jgi:hypothetical protein
MPERAPAVWIKVLLRRVLAVAFGPPAFGVNGSHKHYGARTDFRDDVPSRVDGSHKCERALGVVEIGGPQ